VKVPDILVQAVVETEDALDRLKLAYKERFNRFDPARIVAYRSYGRSDRLLVRGRVMEASETGFEPEPGFIDNLRNTLRRLETDEIRGAKVRATFRDLTVMAEADEEAFLEFAIEPEEPVEAGWHRVRLDVTESMASEDDGPSEAEIRVPPDECDFFVVSDLDDTVVRTGATQRLGMFRTVLLNDAHTRLPFEGVGPLYRALAAGPSGSGANPFFYLSRSAWNLYGMLEGFLDHHDLPKGPLILKDYGMRSLLGREEESYKRDVLDELLAFYPDARFLLIGDSGQHDPEVYSGLARDCPDRVRAIFIRDVTDPGRDREVRAIADEMAEIGVPMVLAGNSRDAAIEAVDLGLIPGRALENVQAERDSEAPAPSLLKRLLRGSPADGGGGSDRSE
jgi:phosphatidate phosphatase APP1